MSKPRIPVTLSLYLGRHFLISALLILGILGLVIFAVDFVELMRRVSARTNGISIFTVLSMTLLKWPEMLFKVMPFAALIGVMLALTKFSRSQELVVTRAAGVSVWQFLFSAWASMFLLGVVALAVLSPISASMLARFERLEARHFSNQSSLLSLSSSGLWLRQVEESRPPITEYILHALKASERGGHLSGITIFAFGQDGQFLARMDAEKALLEKGQWVLSPVTYSQPGKPTQKLQQTTLQTDLTLSQIQDSFASPETLSFWELPEFIATLERAGFSALRHKLHWYKLMALPFTLLGMVMVAAVFALRVRTRRGGILSIIVSGLVAGFIIYFMSDIVFALGLSGTLPPILAAWTPALICLALGTGLLLHLEDG